MPGEPVPSKQTQLSVIVVSGGSGVSGEQIVHTLLAQFPGIEIAVEVAAHVRSPHQVEEIVAQAAATNAILVHTLVNDALRLQLNALAMTRGIVHFDLFGPLQEHLSTLLNQAPLGKPGLYQQLHAAYFKRVEAMEYALAHDDGKRIEDLPLAEIVLVGVSRVGKTPLSMYLSVLGWKVANVALAPGVTLSPILLEIDPRRVIGLTIAPVQLLTHRRWRTKSLGLTSGDYLDRQAIQAELRAANHLFAAHNFAIIDITDKPVETSGEEVVETVTGQLNA